MNILENRRVSGRMDNEIRVFFNFGERYQTAGVFLHFFDLKLIIPDNDRQNQSETLKFHFFHFSENIRSFWMFPRGPRDFLFFEKHIFHIFSIPPPSALVDSVLSLYHYLHRYGARLSEYFLITDRGH